MAAPAAAPATTGGSAPPATRTLVLHTAGGERSALVHHPAGDAQARFGWDAVAERDGLVVAHPEGTLDGFQDTWNGGRCCPPASDLGTDDVGFLDALVRTVRRTDAATTTLSAVGAAAGPADVTGQVCCAAAPAGGVVGGVSTAHNGRDIAFVNFMALHDAVAAEMGDLAPARARSPQVKEVAAAVSDAQGRRFHRMSAMATAWGEPVPPTDAQAAGTRHDHGGGSADATYANAAALAPLSGTAFDRQFLTAMIAHHRSAMPVAQATLDSGENPQARDLTREMVAEQSAELATMQHLLGSL